MSSLNFCIDGELLLEHVYVMQFRLSWDSVVSEAAEDIYFYNGYVTNHTMFRDLLSHQTGISSYDATWVFDPFQNRSDIVE